MSKELKERNQLIYARKHRDKKSYKELSEEFGITETRVRQILEQERRKHRRFANTAQHLSIPEIDYICDEMNVSITTRGRIYNALIYSDLLKFNKWKSMTRDQLMKIANLGEYSVDIILKAAKIS
jgi:predicted transcriptional regulator